MNNKPVCPICLDVIDKNIKKLSCNHLFHTDCINKWFNYNTSCPTCRNPHVLNQSKKHNTTEIFVLQPRQLRINFKIIFKKYIKKFYHFIFNYYLFNLFNLLYILTIIFVKLNNYLISYNTYQHVFLQSLLDIMSNIYYVYNIVYSIYYIKIIENYNY